jgi:hypothetical protein
VIAGNPSAHLRRVRRFVAAAAFLLPMACATNQADQPPQQEQLARAVAPPTRLEPPEYLPGSARALLRTRMAGHAQQMSGLVSAIMVLRYEEIAERATAIAEDAHFARPLTGDASELNSALPEKFFAYDRELRVWASTLASMAEEMDALRVSNAYGGMAQVCVRCHATYRAGR